MLGNVPSCGHELELKNYSSVSESITLKGSIALLTLSVYIF